MTQYVELQMMDVKNNREVYASLFPLPRNEIETKAFVKYMLREFERSNADEVILIADGIVWGEITYPTPWCPVLNTFNNPASPVRLYMPKRNRANETPLYRAALDK